MAIVPKGNPAFVRSSDITTLDGNVNKQNYLGIGIVDPRTDYSAEGFSRLVEIVAAAEKTIPRCVITLQCRDSIAANPTIVSHLGMYTQPTVARISDGYVSLTFPASESDVYGVSGGFTVSSVASKLLGISTNTTQQDFSSSIVYVKAVNSAGVAQQNQRITVMVW
jgi:hypothetical protein